MGLKIRLRIKKIFLKKPKNTDLDIFFKSESFHDLSHITCVFQSINDK